MIPREIHGSACEITITTPLTRDSVNIIHGGCGVPKSSLGIKHTAWDEVFTKHIQCKICVASRIIPATNVRAIDPISVCVEKEITTRRDQINSDLTRPSDKAINRPVIKSK
jgi:hypothetical protein